MADKTQQIPSKCAERNDASSATKRAYGTKADSGGAVEDGRGNWLALTASSGPPKCSAFGLQQTQGPNSRFERKAGDCTADVRGLAGALPTGAPKCLIELEGPRAKRGFSEGRDRRGLVAIEPVDLRKGVDSLAQLSRERLGTGCLFVFRDWRATAIKLLAFEGRRLWVA